MALTGIYKIQSKINPDRIYIGSSVNIDRRWKDHLKLLRKKKHHSPQMQKHFNKYGITDLEFSVIFECNNESLIIMEQQFLENCNPYFNTSSIAGSPMAGLKHSEKAKKKISNTLKGRIFSEEHRENLSTSRRTNPNQRYTKEIREKISQANIQNGNKPPSQKGRKRTSEQIERWKESRNKNRITNQK